MTENDVYKLNKKPPHFPTSAVEWKLTKLPYIAYSHLQPHQIKYLLQVVLSRIDVRIADARTRGGIGGKSPFDEIHLAQERGVVAVVFHKKGRQNLKQIVCYIDIEELLAEEKRTLRKSLTEERAREIAFVVATLGGEVIPR